MQILAFILPTARELSEPVSVDVVDLLPDWTRGELGIYTGSRLCASISTHDEDRVEDNERRSTSQRDALSWGEIEDVRYLYFKTPATADPCARPLMRKAAGGGVLKCGVIAALGEGQGGEPVNMDSSQIISPSRVLGKTSSVLQTNT